MNVNTETLDDFSARWNKKARGEIAFAPEAEVLNPSAISLDIPAVDMMLGGGIPRGRTSVFIGEPSSGKTLLAQLVCAAAQRQGGRCVFIDAEHCFDAKWFALTGVDTSPSKLLVMRPRNLEQTFDVVTDALETLRPEVLIVDSVPALVPKAMLDAEMEKQDFRGVQARKVTEGIAKVTQYNQTTALIFINQLRTSMGVSFGNPESMPGGRALRFYTSLIIRVRRGAWLTTASESRLAEEEFTSLEDDKEARRIGFMLRLRTEKSKVSPPWQECSLKFFFNGVVDPLGSLIHLANQRGVITVSAGGYYSVPGITKKLHGLDAVENLLRMSDDVKDRVVQLIKEAS